MKLAAGGPERRRNTSPNREFVGEAFLVRLAARHAAAASPSGEAGSAAGYTVEKAVADWLDEGLFHDLRTDRHVPCG